MRETSKFTEAVWLLVKIGIALVAVPTVLYFLSALPALVTGAGNPWTR